MEVRARKTGRHCGRELGDRTHRIQSTRLAWNTACQRLGMAKMILILYLETLFVSVLAFNCLFLLDNKL